MARALHIFTTTFNGLPFFRYNAWIRSLTRMAAATLLRERL